MAVLPFKREGGKAASGYKMVHAAKASSAEIYIYGPIGESWFGDGVSANQFRQDLSALGAVKTLDVRINSEGGDVFDGQAIYNLLVQHPATVAVHIDGLAASTASFIAMAGKTIEIGESAFMMIHGPSGGCFGPAGEMRRTADLLDSVSTAMCKLYCDRTGQTMAAVKKMMDAETWMSGTEAVAEGFADKCVANMAVAACILDPTRYRHLPTPLHPNQQRADAALQRINDLMERRVSARAAPLSPSGRRMTKARRGAIKEMRAGLRRYHETMARLKEEAFLATLPETDDPY